MKPQFKPARTLFQLVILAGLVVVGLNYQWLLDQYALATFQPSPAVAAIESRLDLTPAATALFARARPQIDDKATFNKDCATTKGELELGCFYQGRIYILQITNESLAPEMDVVMAHELLHASWDRLSQADQDRLSSELEQTYHRLNDPDLNQRMAGYAKSEPGQEVNELHSILGTEQASLPADLESYYQRYFTSRPQIVTAHAAYQNVFTSQRAQLEAELASIRALKGQLAVINQQLENYRSAGQIGAYNSLVPRQNSLVDDINNRIEAYRTGVDEYNALSKSLDSQEITDTESGVSSQQ
ncbi:MAG TPA: hypothetical protein VLI05_00095 [Candidatus Saccharimonadia bacterium]|nr:hypothetical protein [Candidatus Saccharimonadia bacterium]